MLSYYPDAMYVLIEANRHHELPLRKLCKRYKNAHAVMAAAGDHAGEAAFERSSDPFGGRVTARVDNNHMTVPMVTIDDLVDSRHLQPPFLIKLDTHGFEVQILSGARRTLENTAVVIIECYFFRHSDNLLVAEMMAHMDSLGFRCMDLFDQLYRPGDLALWQADLTFVKKSSAEFLHNSYQVR
jgi:FkbM family methyltransferase